MDFTFSENYITIWSFVMSEYHKSKQQYYHIKLQKHFMQLTKTTFEFTVNLQFILTASRLNPLTVHQGKSPNLKKVLEPENSKTSG